MKESTRELADYVMKELEKLRFERLPGCGLHLFEIDGDRIEIEIDNLGGADTSVNLSLSATAHRIAYLKHRVGRIGSLTLILFWDYKVSYTQVKYCCDFLIRYGDYEHRVVERIADLIHWEPAFPRPVREIGKSLENLFNACFVMDETEYASRARSLAHQLKAELKYAMPRKVEWFTHS